MQPEPPVPPAGVPVREPGPAARRGGVSILHLTALVAGSAAMAALWPLVPHLTRPPFSPTFHWPTVHNATAFVVLSMFLWAPGLAAALLIGPAGRRREAARSYGTAAAVATTLAGAWLATQSLGEMAVRMRHNAAVSYLPASPFEFSLLIFPFADSYFCPAAQALAEAGPAAASAILVAWATLALTGVGRRPSGWLEWSCLVVALACIAFFGLIRFLPSPLGNHVFHSFWFEFG